MNGGRKEKIDGKGKEEVEGWTDGKRKKVGNEKRKEGRKGRGGKEKGKELNR